MQGVEKAHCNATIKAILNAGNAFWEATIEEALRPVLAYGKTDTLGMDAMPEITIVHTLQEYDPYAVVITEETGSEGNNHFTSDDDPRRFRTIFLSDPTDRSLQIRKLLERTPDKNKPIREILKDPMTIQIWEEDFGVPVSITGGFSAITCVRRGVPIFAVLLNYITRQLFVSCSAGNYSLNLPEDTDVVNLDYVCAKGSKIFFRDLDQHGNLRSFVTFLGKSGYKENLLDSKLMSETEIGKNLFYGQPGGPSRILYLSNMQSEHTRLGFVLANGEKIGEWIHWIPFIRFARKESDQNEQALRLFEIYQDRPWTKEGILMATPPYYSILRPIDRESGKMVIDVSQFSRFENPSRIRSTLIVTPADNLWATRVLNQYGYREIKFFSE